MARITSKSKSRSRRGNLAGCSRLILIGTIVLVILLFAFILYETDQVLFHSKYGKIQYDSVRKNMINHRGHEVYIGPEVVVNRNAAKAGDSPRNEDSGETVGRQRVAFDLQRLKEGSSGTIVIETIPEWAPHGVKRFRELIRDQFYVDCRFFRVVPNFVVQFGMASSPTVEDGWKTAAIPDDPVLRPNFKHTVTFAMSGKNTRTTQLFINLKDNTYLDKEGFAPIGMVVEGHDFLNLINDEYREKPNQGKIANRGNEYLDEEFPHLTYIADIRILDDGNDDQSQGDDEKGDDHRNGGDDKKGSGEEKEDEEKEEDEEEEEEEEQ